MPKIILQRCKDRANMLRAYKVMIDEELVGKIKRAETLEFEVEEGHHIIHCLIDWMGSNKVELEVKDKDVIMEVKAKSLGESAYRAMNQRAPRYSYLDLIILED